MSDFSPTNLLDATSSITETSDVFIVQNGGSIIQNNPINYTNVIEFSINILFILFIIYFIYRSISYY